MLAGFNENQIEAIKHFKGPMMLIAGPGSGKTTVIVNRVKYLIENYNIDPKEILVITFTKAASIEINEKFNSLIKENYKINFFTFHSVFYRIVSYYNGYTRDNILLKEKIFEILDKICKELNVENREIEDFIIKIASEISLVNNNMINIDEYNSYTTTNIDFRNIYIEYNKIKNDLNQIDFDDMLTKCYDILKKDNDIRERIQKKYKYILIDEFQDINKIQYECIKMIVGNEENIFIVGDDDQSIYGFRGSRPEFLLNFAEQYKRTKKVILNINYRSTDEIIQFSNKIISKNKIRYEKNIIGTNKSGVKPKIIYSKDINEEALKIAKKIKMLSLDTNYNDMCVIYRTNVQSNAMLDILMNMNIPFILRDEISSIYEHRICKDICAYINLALNRDDDAAFIRIINKPVRYISKSKIAEAKKDLTIKDSGIFSKIYKLKSIPKWQLSRLDEFEFYLKAIKKRTPYDAFKYIRKAVGYDRYIEEFADFKKINPDGMFEILNELQENSKKSESLVEYLEYIIKMSNELKIRLKKKETKGVTLTTMHSAKGLEFDTVFLIGAVEGVIPHEKSESMEELEEELRLFYVAITRAKNNLYMSVPKTKYEKETSITNFLKI